MDLPLTTPALLFPAISLLLLAYTNRFVTLANVIRALHAEHLRNPNPKHLLQIENLRKRVRMIKNMQLTGVLSFFVCVLCMAALFFDLYGLGKILFATSLLLFGYSLALSIAEIHISVKALDIHLSDIEGS